MTDRACARRADDRMTGPRAIEPGYGNVTLIVQKRILIRPEIPPGTSRFECQCGAKHTDIVVKPANDLQADRQSIRRESGRYRGGRLTGEIERITPSLTDQLECPSIPVISSEGKAHTGGVGDDEMIGSNVHDLRDTVGDPEVADGRE